MYLIDRYTDRLWYRLLLVSRGSYSLKQYIVTGVSGTLIHVLLDHLMGKDGLVSLATRDT